MAYYVFLDTNIYEESNFSFQNGKFTKLKELVESENVILLYNEVVYREVRQHIEEYVKAAVGEYNAAIKNRGFAPFRNTGKWEKQLAVLDEKALVNEQWQAWDDYLKDCHAIKIPTNNVDIDIILDKYFKRQLPFEDKKQNEFKDAITIESIRKYYQIASDNEFAESIYVAAADKGFRKSFRDDKEIVTFDSLNKLLNYVIIHTKYLAEAVDRQMESDVIDRFIKDNIVDEVYTANCDIDGCYDEFDITSVEYRNHKVGYINIVEDSLAEVTLEITAEICVEYAERDEENSYYDKEDGRYLFEEFVKVQETHEVSFEADLELYIDNLDEEAIKQKLNDTKQLIQEYDDELLTITCEPEAISIPKGTIIAMDEWSLSEREIVSQTIDDNWDEEEWTGDKPYTTCPACGKPISHQNDGGNGFCIDCAWEH